MNVETNVAPGATDDRLAPLSWLVYRMERQPDLKTTLQSVVRQARAADLADTVGVLIVTNRTIRVGFASDLDVRRADELQLESRQGPGVEAILTGRNYISDDLRLDSRWRFWGPRAAAAGWLSVLTVGLRHGHTFGSLNVYSRQTHSFSGNDLLVAETFAGHASTALARARKGQDHLPGQLLGTVTSPGLDADAASLTGPAKVSTC